LYSVIGLGLEFSPNPTQVDAGCKTSGKIRAKRLIDATTVMAKKTIPIAIVFSSSYNDQII
jgi:hypothetical protein